MRTSPVFVSPSPSSANMASMTMAHPSDGARDGRAIAKKGTARLESAGRTRRYWYLLAILASASLVLIWGWAQFWFLTDDAFIAFRYVSNSRLGYGYVWNASPFLPVEGYTSFLWVVLLDGVWRATGWAPPDACNWLSLCFAWLTLVLAGAMIWRVDVGERFASIKPALTGLALLALTTNRTFLCWSSSGLETAMFAFFVTAWIGAACCLPERTIRWVVLTVLSATLLYLTRPDGMLFVAATVAMVGWAAVSRPGARLGLFVAMTPVLAVPLHLLWRHRTYGVWIPNTYLAKFTAVWPSSGIRYLLSFVLEYALWVWLGLIACAAIRLRPCIRRSRWTSPRWFVVATLLVHAAYYTFIIGGDHFEYRVYNHLWVPLYVSVIWLVVRVARKPRAAVAALVFFVLLSYPIPWSHWAQTHHLSTRDETVRMRVAIAPHWPRTLRWYAGWFDDLQFWLIAHLVCVRHQEHKINLLFLKSLFPPRTEGSEIAADGLPVLAFSAVGLASWVLPNVNIIDLHGLNDPVVARVQPRAGERQMAHERLAPEAYVVGFRPNLMLSLDRGLSPVRRDRPLTAAEVVAHQARWMRQVAPITSP